MLRAAILPASSQKTSDAHQFNLAIVSAYNIVLAARRPSVTLPGKAFNAVPGSRRGSNAPTYDADGVCSSRPRFARLRIKAANAPSMPPSTKPSARISAFLGLIGLDESSAG